MATITTRTRAARRRRRATTRAIVASRSVPANRYSAHLEALTMLRRS